MKDINGNTKPRFTETEIAQQVRDLVHTSINNADVGTRESRDLAYDFYYGDRPYAIDGNSSDYVSRDVFDAVEGLKAKLLRTFRSSREVVRFKPASEQDVEAANVRTKYVSKIIDREGSGYKFLHDMFHDGLLTKIATVTFDLVETEEYETENFTDVPVEQLEVLAEREDIETIIVETEEDKQVMVPTQLGPSPSMQRVASGNVTVRKQKREILLDVVPPENVFIPGDCVDVTQLNELVLRYHKPRYQLVKEGFDPAEVEKLKPTFDLLYNDRNRDRYRTTFNRPTGDRQLCEIFVAYLQLDMETPKGQPAAKTRLYRVVTSESTVLDIEPVDRINARFWSPIMVAHKAIGLSMADVTMDLQTTVSNTVRGMEDNVHRVNAGVRMANMDVIRNPRDLIDNPIGAIINTSDMNSVSVAPQPSLSPATGGLLEILSLQKEMRTGDTRLGKGLQTQDVVTHQNSKDMIDQLINVGNERPLQMARCFAETCLMPLMQDIYRLGYENDYVVALEIDGQQVQFNPKMLPYAEDIEIDVALTPEYGQQRAAQLTQAHTMLMQNPAIGPLYTLEEQYAVMSEVFHLLGTANWLADPKDPKVQQRMQAMQQASQQQQQLQQMITAKQLELAEREVAVKEKGVGIQWQAKKEDLDLRAAIAATNQDFREREFSWSQRVDVAELQLERQQQRPVALGDRKVARK